MKVVAIILIFLVASSEVNGIFRGFREWAMKQFNKLRGRQASPSSSLPPPKSSNRQLSPSHRASLSIGGSSATKVNSVCSLLPPSLKTGSTFEHIAHVKPSFIYIPLAATKCTTISGPPSTHGHEIFLSSIKNLETALEIPEIKTHAHGYGISLDTLKLLPLVIDYVKQSYEDIHAKYNYEQNPRSIACVRNELKITEATEVADAVIYDYFILLNTVDVIFHQMAEVSNYGKTRIKTGDQLIQIYKKHLLFKLFKHMAMDLSKKEKKEVDALAAKLGCHKAAEVVYFTNTFYQANKHTLTAPDFPKGMTVMEVHQPSAAFYD